jgi:hypothetical protein
MILRKFGKSSFLPLKDGCISFNDISISVLRGCERADVGVIIT